MTEYESTILNVILKKEKYTVPVPHIPEWMNAAYELWMHGVCRLVNVTGTVYLVFHTNEICMEHEMSISEAAEFFINR